MRRGASYGYIFYYKDDYLEMKEKVIEPKALGGIYIINIIKRDKMYKY